MKLINGDCLEVLKATSDNSVDLIVTDPPYGMSFMGKDWDKAVPNVEIWKDCVRRQDGTFLEHFYGDKGVEQITYGDSGSFSRYFDLDKWYNKTFPFFITPKASKSEKNKGCEGFTPKPKCIIDKMGGEKCTMKKGSGNERNVHYLNNHPTCKPLKLMCYLITLGSRKNDVVVDPFMGSGTTGLACNMLNREFIGMEVDEDYFKIAEARIKR